MALGIRPGAIFMLNVRKIIIKGHRMFMDLQIPAVFFNMRKAVYGAGEILNRVDDKVND